MENEDEHSAMSDADRLCSSFDQMKSSRKQEIDTKLKSVSRLGSMMSGLGLFMYAIVFGFWTSNNMSRLTYMGLGFICILTTSSGILIASTVPYDSYDFDEMVYNTPRVRISYGFACTFMGFVIGLIPPYMGFLLSTGGIILCLDPYPIVGMKFSLMFSIWLIVFFMLNLPWSIWAAVKCGSDLDKNVLFGVRAFDILSDKRCRPMWWMVSSFVFVYSVFLPYYLYEKYKNFLHSTNWTFATTKMVYETIYFWLFGIGCTLSIQGIMTGALLRERSFDTIPLILGITFLLPLAIVMIIGREYVFNLAARVYNSNISRLEKDGAFIAKLLDSVNIEVGHKWWVHLPKGVLNPEYANTDDTRKFWIEGTIIGVTDSKLHIAAHHPLLSHTTSNNKLLNFGKLILKESYDEEANEKTTLRRNSTGISSKLMSIGLPLKSRKHIAPSVTTTTRYFEDNLNCNDMQPKALIDLAIKQLRYVDWSVIKDIGPTLFDKSNRTGDSLYHLSKPASSLPRSASSMGGKRRIDFFISHAWDDDPIIKFKKLEELVKTFKAEKGRAPTFWLDKMCIDQSKIGDGLKTLPITLMKCSHLLILAGERYVQRLWCVWELCTLFCFEQAEAEVERKINNNDIEMNDLNVNVNVNDVKYDGSTTSTTRERDRNGNESPISLNTLQKVVFASLADVKGTIEALISFDLNYAHAYSPNEEWRLFMVINSVGRERFHSCIRRLGVILREEIGNDKDMSFAKQLNRSITAKSAMSPILSANMESRRRPGTGGTEKETFDKV
jgi:hypothetical protein